jgi:hypothetical protein
MLAAIDADECGRDRIFMRDNRVVNRCEKPTGFAVGSGQIQKIPHLPIIQVVEDARGEDSIEAMTLFGQPVSGVGTIRFEKAVGGASKAVSCQLDVSGIRIETDVSGDAPRQKRD